ncbi:hypothetical protein [Rhodococcus sp. 1163]|uniref:hypothetical protein n=1 Tax=Rhodococcus sp. 1163 TaxID=1905289 RepID=UPI00211A526B|nr:hypothetical protein [Rhodococcus sp. 1163]
MMSRPLVLTALAVATALSAAACGGSDAPSDDAPKVALGPAVAAPDLLLGSPITDSATLQSAMLTMDLLPDGFAPIPDPVRDLGMDPAPEYDAPDRSGTDPQACGDVLAPIERQVPGASAGADVRYSGPNFSSLDEDAASYPGRGAAEAFTALQNTFAQCTEYSGTDADGVRIDYRLEGREQKTVGDASVSVRLTIDSGGYTLISDVVVAVVDSTVVQLVGTDQEAFDSALMTELATTAVDRIRGADRGV